MKIAVFCSANTGIDPDFFRMTEELGHWAGSNGHGIVFGGYGMGLMECVAKAARQTGGTTVGVIPKVMERGGRASDNVDVAIPCDNLSDRKELMLARSDVAIALPGGIGTLDEVFTVAASAAIGYHQKHVILYNMKGYWDGLVALLDDIQSRRMICGDWRRHISIACSLDEIKEAVSRCGGAERGQAQV